MKLMIEEDSNGMVNVTTDEESMNVDKALLLIELAKMSILSYYIGGDSEAPPSDEGSEVETLEQ